MQGIQPVFLEEQKLLAIVNILEFRKRHHIGINFFPKIQATCSQAETIYCDKSYKQPLV